MPDGLTERQRAVLWLKRWDRTLVGKCTVNPDFTFRTVNDQFCKILGVTMGELVGRSFADITPEPLRSLDIANAELVKKGVQQHYLLPKVYEPMPKKKIYVALLVEGVYDENRDFLFFESEIVKLSKEEYDRMVVDVIRSHSISVPSTFTRQTSGLLSFLTKYGKGLAIVIGIAAWVLVEAAGMAAKKGKDLWGLLDQLF